MAVLNETIELALDHYSGVTANVMKADVFSFIGGIMPEYLTPFRSHMENLAEREGKTKNLVFLLHTPGGVAEVVEKMVDIIRYHYQEVWYVVPDMAMSAGTILCMSGDKIFMDYSAALGPIDPQVANGDGQLVPALGYLDHVERMIQKSADGVLTDAEFAILQNQDLATLRRYEQAKDLSISLLKDWLVKYKFKDWDKHSGTQKPVTSEEKTIRAEEIAIALSDHKKWHSHGRMIGIKTLTQDLRLRIEDYTENIEMKSAIRQYSDLLFDCVQSRGTNHMIHTKPFEKQPA